MSEKIKIKVLNSIRSRINTWKKIYEEAYKELIKAEATIKILQDVEEEIEFNKEYDDVCGMDAVVQIAHVYCDLFNGKCKDCYFFIDKTKQCAMKIIEKKLNDFKEKHANTGSSEK